MKIERKKPPFEPIVITLESKAEVEHLIDSLLGEYSVVRVARVSRDNLPHSIRHHLPDTINHLIDKLSFELKYHP